MSANHPRFSNFPPTSSLSTHMTSYVFSKWRYHFQNWYIIRVRFDTVFSFFLGNSVLIVHTPPLFLICFIRHFLITLDEYGYDMVGDTTRSKTRQVGSGRPWRRGLGGWRRGFECIVSVMETGANGRVRMCYLQWFYPSCKRSRQWETRRKECVSSIMWCSSKPFMLFHISQLQKRKIKGKMSRIWPFCLTIHLNENSKSK